MKTPFLCCTSVVALFLSVGCAADPPLATATPGAALDFMNGPLDLPNVFRGDSVLSFAWADMTQDMVIVINMPPGGVRALRRCGGTSTRDPQPVQTVGGLNEVLRQLRLVHDVNIHVYQPVPAAFLQPPPGAMALDAFCAVDPIAGGTGNLTSTDNDRLNTEPSANAFGLRAQGVLELATGGLASVTGVRQTVIRPDGTTKSLVSSVVLHPH